MNDSKGLPKEIERTRKSERERERESESKCPVSLVFGDAMFCAVLSPNRDDLIRKIRINPTIHRFSI